MILTSCSKTHSEEIGLHRRCILGLHGYIYVEATKQLCKGGLAGAELH
jgi:hypothetical protein